MTNTNLKAQIDTDITNKTVDGTITPAIMGTDMKALVDYTDQQVATVTGTTGPQGIQGPIGPAGPTAVTPAGLVWKNAWVTATPYILNDAVSYNGASYFCILAIPAGVVTPNLDTTHWAFLAAQGVQGVQGIPGAQGPTGSQGPQGLMGLSGGVGPAGGIGPQGPTGSQGPTGLTGPAGIPGPQGATGAVGPQGPSGAGSTLQQVITAGATYDYAFDELDLSQAKVVTKETTGALRQVKVEVAGITMSSTALGGLILTNNSVAFKNGNNFTSTMNGTAATANRTFNLPDASGTLALTSDITTSVIKTQKTAITNAQVLQLFTTPITILAAATAGTFRQMLGIYIVKKTSGTYTLAANNFLVVESGVATIATIPVNGSLGSSTVGYSQGLMTAGAGIAGLTVTNVPFRLQAQTGNPTGGTSDIDVYVTYSEITL